MRGYRAGTLAFTSLLVLFVSWCMCAHGADQRTDGGKHPLAILAEQAVAKQGTEREACIAKLKKEVASTDLGQAMQTARSLRTAERELLAQLLAEKHGDALPKQAITAVGQDKCTAQFACECCKAVGAGAIPPLIEGAESENRSIRFVAAHGLGLFLDHYPESIGALCRLAEDEDEKIIVSALFSLRRFGHQKERCGPIVRRLLDDERPLVVEVALAAVPRIVGDDDRCLEMMHRIAEDPAREPAIRACAPKAMAWLHLSPKDLLRVARLLDDDHAEIREQVLLLMKEQRELPVDVQERLAADLAKGNTSPGLLLALRNCDKVHIKILPIVSRLLKHKDIEIRRGAARCFAGVLEKTKPTLEPEVRAELIAGLHAPDLHVRLCLAHGLHGYASDPDVRRAIEQQVAVEPNRVARATMQASLEE